VTRLTMALTVFLCCLSSATASLALRNDSPTFGKTTLPRSARDQPLDLDNPAGTSAVEAKSEKQNFVVNDETEVQLDGHVCKFQDVPAAATIVSVDLAADRKTILKIHFKSDK
jgi:hypothetical protein